MDNPFDELLVFCTKSIFVTNKYPFVLLIISLLFILDRRQTLRRPLLTMSTILITKVSYNIMHQLEN